MEERLHILVVDDDQVDRLAVRRALKAGGLAATIDEREDSASAIQALKQQSYDCALLDFQLPGADGLTVLRDVRIVGVTTPVIMLTGHGDEQLAVELMKAGAADYLTKGRFSPESLTQRVRSAVRIHRAEMETALAYQQLRQREETQRFLAQASQLLSTSLDYTTTLTNLAHLVVGSVDFGTPYYLADWCAIDIIEEHQSREQKHELLSSPGAEPPATARPTFGAILHMAIAHIDPAKEFSTREFQHRSSTASNTPYGVREVLHTGQSKLVPAIADGDLEHYAQDAEQLQLLREIGLSSYMIVPLIARGRILGAMTLALTGESADPSATADDRRGAIHSARHYGPGDLTLAEDLARRAALAVDNARLYQEAQQAVRARERFLSIASHELKTPVTVIQGYTQVLMRLVERSLAAQTPAGGSPPDELILSRQRLQNNLGNVEQSTRRLTKLIDELLDVSRIENRKLTLNPEPMSLTSLLVMVVENARVPQRYEYYSQDLTIQLDLPPVGDIWGIFDRNRLEQVLVNLLDNAIKYSPNGGSVWVSLALEDILTEASSPVYAEAPVAQAAGQALPASESFVPVSAGAGPVPSRPLTGVPSTLESQQAHIRVRDEGIGIPPEQQEQIFQPFVRGSNTATGTASGLGLGLAISKEIIERHHGRIWAESPGPGQGSIFHVVLPGVQIREDS